MKRLVLIISITALLASIVWAQTTSVATLRGPSGDAQVNMVRQGEQIFFAADEVLAAFGGSVVKDRDGFKVKLATVEAALSVDSPFAVVREELIELPGPPLSIDNRLFVAPQFFDAILRRAVKLEASWDNAANILTVRAAQAQAVTADVAVVDLPDISKVVVQLSAPVEYSITREPTRYLIQFAGPVQPRAAELKFESPNVTRIAWAGNVAEVNLTSDMVAGDPYRLDNPFRIVIDTKKGVVPFGPGVTQPGTSRKPIELPGIRTIVLDPGHGGKEVGAIGPTGLMEKDTTLAICRKLANLLESQLGTRVILTRNEDEVVPLDARTAIANRYKADLFVSVHLNAAVVRGAKGAETYFLSLEASDEAAKRAAERENLAGGAPQQQGEDLNLILWDLAQQDYLRESSRLAELIQNEMNRISNIQNRGVKQAPFKVLVGATMPAALVEVAFISNPEEEASLKNDAFQSTVANTLLQAISTYKSEYEQRIGIAAPKPATTAAVPAPAATTTAAPSVPTPATVQAKPAQKGTE